MAKTTTATSTKKPQSKKDQSIKIFKRMTNRKVPAGRAEIIKEMQAKVELSASGAATYYQNIASGKKGWEIPVTKPKAKKATA